MKPLEYREAATRLLHAVAGSSPPVATDPDMHAIVSHWLQRPDRLPLGRGRSLHSTFLRELGLHRGGDLRIRWRDEEGPLPFPPSRHSAFTFVDLFAGIGGFRIALQSVGGHCVFSSEWDSSAQETYHRNYGELPFGDIRRITGPSNSDDHIRAWIPDHDVLAAGFPCQPFSRAGVSARRSLGQYDGFACETQGTLFFDIARIVEARRPKAVFLENVRNLITHDGGRTFATIRMTMHKLGYSFDFAIINSQHLVPQQRVRCYIVCLRGRAASFDFRIDEFHRGRPLPLSSVLEAHVDDSFTISDRLWQGHQTRSARNVQRGVGFVTGLADPERPANTLVARYGKDGKECLVPQPPKNPRLLTPAECARLQGFPPHFRIHPSRSQAYRQFGNSVAVPVVRRIARALRPYIVADWAPVHHSRRRVA